MEISDLPSYSIGGTVVNNMIGFTTDPRASRSSYHCTNVAKGIEAPIFHVIGDDGIEAPIFHVNGVDAEAVFNGIEAPIFHVNGDDAEAVFNVCLLAADWRAEFAKDCVVDIVCYRRHGHNELDEPSFTQPLTYSEIARHQCVLEILTRELITEEVVDAQYVKDLSIRVWREFEEEYGMASQYIPDVTEWLSSNWQGQAINALLNSGNRPYNLTGCPIETLTEIGK
ncbi:thiamine diphosphate-binding protein, partial [Baffinella frigidus]